MIETIPELTLTVAELDEVLTDLEAYHAIYGPLFRRREQREWAAVYLQGLLSELPRKSIEPIVLELVGADGNAVRAVQQFVSAGGWEDEAILRRHWQEVEQWLGEADGVLIVDGSDFPKQGAESVGVKRQYCGELGKTANCQAGVFVAYASTKGYTLLDRRLYLPEEWVTDESYSARRARYGVPEELSFHSKPELALQMVTTLQESALLQARYLLCDEGFGRSGAFLDGVVALGLHYFAEVPHDTQLWLQRPATALPDWSGKGRKPTQHRVLEGEPTPLTVLEIATQAPPTAWTRHTIKEGSQGPLVADFACWRVINRRDGLPDAEVWLLGRRHPHTGEIKTFLCNAPADTPLATLLRLSGLRWPIESCFEDSKQLLGMGDYEVRTWRGWHHHMTLVILAHGFLVRQARRLKKTHPA